MYIWGETWGGSSTAATSKMELFLMIVNGFQPLTIITKYSILDVAAALDPHQETCIAMQCNDFCLYYRKIVVKKNGFYIPMSSLIK